MIEESEKLKSNVEGKAEHLADRLVPYTLAGTGLTYLITRNVTKTLAVLMVDFSCALKLAMPISVLSAIREASLYDITVKGGKFLEAIAEADTIVFDKTGTLTKQSQRLQKSKHSAIVLRKNCSVLQPAWKNIFHILWRRLWLMPPKSGIFPTKRCILK